jgi:hypothetical protein
VPGDTPQVIEIKGSPAKLFWLCGLGVLMTALSVVVAIPLLPGFRPNAFQQFVGYGGALFFGACTVVLAWRLVTAGGPVVTITPEGIRDTRVAAEFIPWRAVRKLHTWGYAGQKIMVLAIDPAIELQLTLTKMAQWSRGPNRLLGADGLCITAQGLKIDYQTLFDISQNHIRLAKQA